VTCTKVIKVKVGGTEIRLMGGMNTTINGIQMMQAPQLRFNGGVLVHTDLFTILFLSLELDIFQDRRILRVRAASFVTGRPLSSHMYKQLMLHIYDNEPPFVRPF